jgi:DHA2 family multidrug resistance protein-like MFS transporter
MSLPMPLLTNILLGAAPPEKAGSAASLSETGGEFGIALGVASLGTLGTVVYRHELAANLPTDVPSAVADAARDSITAATTAAQGLPGGAAADLMDVAGTAFASGLSVVAIVGTVLFTAMAVATAVVLREPAAAGGEPAPQPAPERAGETAAPEPELV